MNLEELKQKHLQEWSQFFDERAKSMQELVRQRTKIDPIIERLISPSDEQKELAANLDDWSKKRGVNGLNQKILCLEQSKDFMKYYTKQALMTRMLDAFENQKELTP